MRRNTTTVTKPRALQNNSHNAIEKGSTNLANRSLSNHTREKIIQSPERG
jgi:hypothetical protein